MSTPLVGVVMGSSSDWEVMKHAALQLKQLGIHFEAKVVSAHRTPDLLYEYASSAEARGLKAIIAGAGVKSLWDVISDASTGALTSAELVLFPAGFLAAAVSGFLCMRFLVNYLRKHPIDVFVYYRWGLAILVAVVALIR